MSVALGIEWHDGEYDVDNSISQSTAQRIAKWAKDEGLPMLSQIDQNGWPQFDLSTLDGLMAEFELCSRWWSGQFGNASDPAAAFLPRLKELKKQVGWNGDFG